MIGYADAGNPFKFDLSLNYRLLDVINQNAEGKPTLVFCATRKGAQQAAVHLAHQIASGAPHQTVAPVSAEQHHKSVAAHVRRHRQRCSTRNGADSTAYRAVACEQTNAHLTRSARTSTEGCPHAPARIAVTPHRRFANTGAGARHRSRKSASNRASRTTTPALRFMIGGRSRRPF